MKTAFKKLRATYRIAFILCASLILNLILLLFPGSTALRGRITSLFFRIILKVSGIILDANIPEPPSGKQSRILIVSNHISYLDILVICALQPCVFLAKSEVASWPVFGWVARTLGCIFVKRDSLMGRACALRRCLFAHKHSSIAIFPEGTTTAQAMPDIKTWTQGHAWLAKRSNIDAVLCLGLSYEKQNERAWTDDISLVPHLLQTLSEEKIRMHIQGTWISVQANTHPPEIAKATLSGVCYGVTQCIS